MVEKANNLRMMPTCFGISVWVHGGADTLLWNTGDDSDMGQGRGKITEFSLGTSELGNISVFK